MTKAAIGVLLLLISAYQAEKEMKKKNPYMFAFVLTTMICEAIIFF